MCMINIYLYNDKNESLKKLMKLDKHGAGQLSQRIEEILNIFKFYKKLFPEMMDNKSNEER